MKKMPEVIAMENLFKYNFSDYQKFKLNYKTNYGFIRSLCVKDLTKDVKDYIDSIDSYDNFIQVGIGGSALGANASIGFLNGLYSNYKSKKRYFALDNIDPQRLDFVMSLDFEKTVFHIVSKSGSTIETLSQFFIIFEEAEKRLKCDVNKHFVFTTSDKGFLYEFAQEHNIKTFFIPREVGGRYSVFTTAGLLAISFLGNNIDRFVEGAKTAVRAFRNGWNMPLDFASFTVTQYNNGKNMLIMFAYKDMLYGAADWFRQLWAESLGKDSKGQTPIKALGTTDQHSQLQLYMDGPKDKTIIFLDTLANNDFKIGNAFDFEYLKDKHISQIMDAEKQATLKSLTENSIPCGSIFLTQKDEFALGALYISLMIATVKAADILGINPFDQPGVELGKVYTKRFLLEDNNG